MDFSIADTFTTSLTRLSGDEQKAVKIAVFDLRANLAHPSLNLHKLDRAQDKNFWSVRVSGDVRLIVHRLPGSITICYVDHHDKAYAWAERRKLAAHPTTGAMQMVELIERTEEIVIPRYVEGSPTTTPRGALFSALPAAALLRLGVPPECMKAVQEVDEDGLLAILEHLPKEAAEALLGLATGAPSHAISATASNTGTVLHENTVAYGVDPAAASLADPFAHPDAQRRFRLIATTDELAQALDYPWEKWTVFLHPAQREAVTRTYGGPARVSGTAGTGKTIVALHRAVQLARTRPDARILLTTFSDTLANLLHRKLRILLASEPRLADQIEVQAIDAVALRLYAANFGRAQLPDTATIRAFVAAADASVPPPVAPATRRGGAKWGLTFLLGEWENVVDAWQLRTLAAYREVPRLGRRTRLSDQQRADVWVRLAPVWDALAGRGLTTQATVYTHLAAHYASGAPSPYDCIVVDEAQDLGVAQLRFLAAVGRTHPDSLFFAGDLGQRIFQPPFSWKALGVDVRGRSRTLRINYRTSHQIRRAADRLLGPEIADVDGNKEDRRHAVSVFSGPLPEYALCGDEEAEAARVGDWLAARQQEGVAPHEIGLFVRSAAQLPRAEAAATAAALPYRVLDATGEPADGYLAISTMHLAKGLEFRAVAVMACDDEVLPLQARIETAADESELEEVYNTERHLLYVACTRAREALLVTGVAPGSEFLEDLRNKPNHGSL
jgi:hypothetical protein